jgi:hypothetical protein
MGTTQDEGAKRGGDMTDEKKPSGQEGSQGETEEPAEAQAPEATPEAETPAERMREPVAEPMQEERRSYLLMAGMSAAVVVVGVALFAAGFFTQSLLDDDLESVEEELAVLTGEVGAIQDILGGAVPSPAPSASPPATPPPVVAASADDDPFIGPEDASVTIIGFTDYQ